MNETRQTLPPLLERQLADTLRRFRRLRLLRAGARFLLIAIAALAAAVTLGAMALLEGMWTDFLTHPTSFSRDTSVRIVMRFLAAICPGKFPD